MSCMASNMKFFVTCLFLVIAAFNGASATNFTNCDVGPGDPPIGQVLSVHIQDCPDNETCNLTYDINKTISFDFVPLEADENVAAIGDMEFVKYKHSLPITFHNKYACGYVGSDGSLGSGTVQCPLASGKNNTYNNTFVVERPILYDFGGDVTLIIQLWNYGDTIVCFKIPAVIDRGYEGPMHLRFH